MKGIDVSEHQGSIDWQAVKYSGVEFAIIRAGWGEVNNPIGGDMDSRALENISGALSAGIKIGLYVYSYAVNVDEGLLEAKFMKKVLVQFPKDSFPCGIWIDVEDEKYQGNVDVNPIIDVFCTEIQNAGYKAGYYCNLNWYNNKINQATKDKWKLFWLAQYNDSPSISSSIWQYSRKGNIPGISGNVDMNTSYIDFSDTPKENKPIEIIVQPETSAIVDLGVEYEVFVEGYGWTLTSRNGFLAGTTGQSKRIEKVRIRLTGVNGHKIYVHYNVHVQDHGWMGFVADGAEAGIEGKRIEAIQIQLVGDDAVDYIVQFRSHNQDLGTLDWAKNGESSGTDGAGLRMEAIQIIITEKGVDLGLSDIPSFKHFDPKPIMTEISPVGENMASEHFAMSEYACDCVRPEYNFGWCDGFPVGMAADLLSKIEQLRVNVGVPIWINSGVRCEQCNSYWGGVPDSLHKLGEAADLNCPALSVDELADAALAVGLGVIRYYSSQFVHVQVYPRDSVGD